MVQINGTTSQLLAFLTKSCEIDAFQSKDALKQTSRWSVTLLVRFILE
jgi:hypothetical protein